jgi:hypothetical protein
LIAGFFVATTAMMLWNYLVAPIYMGVSREEVARLLLPAFLPFNLIKNGLNAAITILLYKHIKTILNISTLLPSQSDQRQPARLNVGIILVALFVLASCVLWVLVLQGII